MGYRNYANDIRYHVPILMLEKLKINTSFLKTKLSQNSFYIQCIKKLKSLMKKGVNAHCYSLAAA